MDTLVLDNKTKKICDKKGYEVYRAKTNEIFTQEDIPSLLESMFFWIQISIEKPTNDLQYKINERCYERFQYCIKELRKLQPSSFLEYMIEQRNLISLK